MVVVPDAIAATTPVVSLIVATAVLLLAHLPPVVELVNVVVEPAQILLLPLMDNDVVWALPVFIPTIKVVKKKITDRAIVGG